MGMAHLKINIQVLLLNQHFSPSPLIFILATVIRNFYINKAPFWLFFKIWRWMTCFYQQHFIN